jgi:hypothetical protein
LFLIFRRRLLGGEVHEGQKEEDEDIDPRCFVFTLLILMLWFCRACATMYALLGREIVVFVQKGYDDLRMLSGESGGGWLGQCIYNDLCLFLEIYTLLFLVLKI